MRIIVVGAGLLGVSSAYFLAVCGAEVTVIDRATSVAAGASHANAGLLIASSAQPLNSPDVLRVLWRGLMGEGALSLRAAQLLPLLGWGLRFMRGSRPERVRRSTARNTRLAVYSLELMRQLKNLVPALQQQRKRGTLSLYRDGTSLASAAADRERLEGFGLRLERMSRDEVIQTEPALLDVDAGVLGGIHSPDDESGDAREFTEVLAVQAAKLGVRFCMAESVVDFERDRKGVVAVLTNRQRHSADAVVLAAGCWSARLAALLGLSLPVVPVRGYSVTLETGAWTQRPQLPVLDSGAHAVLTPLGTRLRITGFAEFAGYDSSCKPSRIESLYSRLLRIYPSVAPYLDRSRAQPWAGLRPLSADGVPFIGATAITNVFLNTGHGQLGWTLAAGSGRLLADLMSGVRPALDAADYSPRGR